MPSTALDVLHSLEHVLEEVTSWTEQDVINNHIIIHDIFDISQVVAASTQDLLGEIVEDDSEHSTDSGEEVCAVSLRVEIILIRIFQTNRETTAQKADRLALKRTVHIWEAAEGETFTISDLMSRIDEQLHGTRQTLEDDGFIRLFRGYSLVTHEEIVSTLL
jgi:hypothetical protein